MVEKNDNWKFGILFFIALLGVFFPAEALRSIIVDINSPIDDNGNLEVSLQDYNGKSFSFYLTKPLQFTNITVYANSGNTTINVSNTTNCLVGDAVDIYDANNYFQGLIQSKTANSITFVAELDTDFGIGSGVKCGEWNMNVDGSVNVQEFYIFPPYNKSWDLESTNIGFIDNADMDSSLFGSRSALTRGFSNSIEDGYSKQFYLIYNNIGFSKRGFDYTSIPKAPSGLYSILFELLFEAKYGAIPRLDGITNDKYIATIRDDITSQTELSQTVQGHYKSN